MISGHFPTLSIVVPIYNEAPNISPLVDRLTRARADLITCCAVEVIFVDDHSTDASPSLLKATCAQVEWMRYLRLSRNSGSHVAILCGIEHARGDCIAFLAGDLQDPPELISQMVDLWQAGTHTVWAVRQARDDLSWRERALAAVFYWLLNHMAQVRMPPHGADFALLDRRVADALIRSVGANPSLGGDIARLGFKQAFIQYTRSRRERGQPKWRLEHRLKAFADAFVSFSYTPLRGMSYLGIACGVLGFVYAVVVIVLRLLTSTPVEGWASLVVIVLVLSGVQMAMVGVLGEYLWRTLEEARRRPRYMLEDSYGFETSKPDPVAGRLLSSVAEPGSAMRARQWIEEKR
jgi:polyisoprenyl-phosphate glycosyltransferase